MTNPVALSPTQQFFNGLPAQLPIGVGSNDGDRPRFGAGML